ncbi:MAG: hypothetical protein ABI720_09855 [Actinomycetes bacterium]
MTPNSRPRGSVVAVAAALVVVLSSCSNEIESAMSEGCSALPKMAAAYSVKDRSAFDEAEDQAQRVSFAYFKSLDLTDDLELSKDAAAASTAYTTLYSAAYAPAESTNGRTVWRGLTLTSSQQEVIDQGLRVCEDY